MAINPLSDIVLDVARAADPAARRMAASRLEALANGTLTLDAELVDGQNLRPSAPHLPFDAANTLVHLRNNNALTTPSADPYQQFESHLLQTFVESMLPEESSALYGAGTAGEIWKSMLADGIATQMAEAGGIGIAKMLAGAADTGTENQPQLSASTRPINEVSSS